MSRADDLAPQLEISGDLTDEAIAALARLLLAFSDATEANGQEPNSADCGERSC